MFVPDKSLTLGPIFRAYAPALLCVANNTSKRRAPRPVATVRRSTATPPHDPDRTQSPAVKVAGWIALSTVTRMLAIAFADGPGAVEVTIFGGSVGAGTLYVPVKATMFVPDRSLTLGPIFRV